MKRNITVEFTNERIIPNGGLAVVDAILGKSNVWRDVFRHVYYAFEDFAF